MAVHARSRGAESWWKSFTTGKSAEMLGGVPHDRYGMTSLSVRQFVLGTYKQLGLREKDITKVQTGGPGSFPVSPSPGLRCGHVLIGFLDLVSMTVLPQTVTWGQVSWRGNHHCLGGFD